MILAIPNDEFFSGVESFLKEKGFHIITGDEESTEILLRTVSRNETIARVVKLPSKEIPQAILNRDVDLGFCREDHVIEQGIQQYVHILVQGLIDMYAVGSYLSQTSLSTHLRTLDESQFHEMTHFCATLANVHPGAYLSLAHWTKEQRQKILNAS